MQWQVSTMERTLNDSESGLEGVVNVLHWQCTDSDGEHHGRCYGSVGLEAPDADSFTAYADISHDDAVEWAKSALGEEAVSQYEDSVASQIELSKNPVQASGTPWT